MKVIIAFAAFVCVALAAPQKFEGDATIVSQHLDNIGVDGYSFSSQTSNGIAQQESGKLLNVGTDHESIDVQGQYEYIGPDGVKYEVKYLANEGGFQPQGAHLPS